jgi:hypothetical protein
MLYDMCITRCQWQRKKFSSRCAGSCVARQAGAQGCGVCLPPLFIPLHHGRDADERNGGAAQRRALPLRTDAARATEGGMGALNQRFASALLLPPRRGGGLLLLPSPSSHRQRSQQTNSSTGCNSKARINAAQVGRGGGATFRQD